HPSLAAIVAHPRHTPHNARTAEPAWASQASAPTVPREPLKSAPAFFDGSNLTATQRFATSKDGTRVPYFLIHRADLAPGDPLPTLLYGYGGFEISLPPSYSARLGIGWLERGGAYALANIRRGGGVGPGREHA